MKLRLALVAFLFAGAALAQPGDRPYAAEERRAVKSLSETEIADLLAGRGMGLAKAAELNDYPGPMHVLEHAEALKLSPEQRAAVEAVRARMAAAARALGREIVARERALDAAFAERRIDQAALAVKTAEIGALMGRLRAVHLAAHLETRAVLEPRQIAEYNALRGYTAPKTGRPGHPHRHH
jgi:Spy/CpxP family protein refolding chaperone